MTLIQEVLERNGYELRQPLGRGGMSAGVFAAYELRRAEEIALKMVVGNDNGSRTRLVQEYLFLKTNVHPNLVTVYDIREYQWKEQSFMWFTMELCQGSITAPLAPDTIAHLLAHGHPLTQQTIRAAQKRGIKIKRLHAMDLGDRILRCLEFLNALAHIHDKGLAHRDLKPDNLLLSISGHLKLADFGTAKLVTEDQFAELVGTPRYIAPECWRAGSDGELGDTDLIRADQYSAAITIAEILQRGTMLPKLEALPMWRPTKEVMIAYALTHRDGVYEPIKIPELEAAAECLNEILQRMLSVQPYQRFEYIARCEGHMVTAMVKDGLLRAA